MCKLLSNIVNIESVKNTFNTKTKEWITEWQVYNQQRIWKSDISSRERKKKGEMVLTFFVYNSETVTEVKNGIVEEQYCESDSENERWWKAIEVEENSTKYNLTVTVLV